MDIAEFLLARIAEDETTARHAAVGTWHFADMQIRADDVLVVRHTWPQEAAHIVSWQPTRVLAECEAKRRIVALAGAADSLDWDQASEYGDLLSDEGPTGTLMLYALAAVYADHPDCDPAWKPAGAVSSRRP